jgi:hypothetical protein
MIIKVRRRWLLSLAELVTNIILEAVISKEPNLRNLAGKDVEILAETMSDTEFRNMI